MQKLLELINKLTNRKFYGILEIHFGEGLPIRCKIIESVKL